MALTAAQVYQHIAKWENYLRGKSYPHRVGWPSKLFHHCPIENAVSILRDGNIRSRNDEENCHDLDVAGQGIIDTTDVAHASSRFYFRPRTPTQYHIEGIRKPSDCEKFGPSAHAPILVMFVLRAQNILTLDGTRFSNKNMQILSAQVGDNLQFFDTIPFEKVYHQGSIAGDYSIIDHRCAEVLAESPVDVANTLESICCRSVTERETLLHMMGAEAENWRGKIQISDDLKVFDREFAFVQTAEVTESGLVISINRRKDGKNIKLEATARNAEGQIVLNFINEDIPCNPPNGSQWRIENLFAQGRYEVSIKIDNHLAANFITNFESSLI